MRILLFITSLRTGGAERLVTGLAQRMRADGDEAAVLLMDGTQTPQKDELEHAGIPVHALSKGWRAMRNPFLVLKLVRFLRLGGYDLIHTHNTSCQMMAAAASLFIPLALITTEHNTTNKRRSWKAFKPLDRWMYGRYRRIICVGDETKSALTDYLPEVSGKTVVIANGIDLDRFRLAVPAKDLTGTAGFRVLMVAAFRAQKDHACLIRAISLLPETYHLYLAGGAETPEDEKTLSACKDLVRTDGLASRVFFLGVRNDIPSLLAACDVTVLSSHHEGMSLSAVECMSSGKAFIASDVAGLRDLVSGAGILFPPGDAKTLAETIRQVCENPAIAAETARKCQERARQYDIDETARRYKEEYARVIAWTDDVEGEETDEKFQ